MGLESTARTERVSDQIRHRFQNVTVMGPSEGASAEPFHTTKRIKNSYELYPEVGSRK